ncbi:MAG: nucleoid-associated protein [Clostridium fessum]
MKSEDMILKAAIVHILDSSVGIPVLSDQSMEVGPDFSSFHEAHIEKITESDDVKHCTFAEGSEVKELLQNCTPDNFVETSKQLAERLYDIMNANIDIPAADVAMTVFDCTGQGLSGILKDELQDLLHASDQRNETAATATKIILQRALLPGRGQRLSRAFVTRSRNSS